MVTFKIREFSIGRKEKRVFVVAEIGQNHQGCMEIAKRMISEAKVKDNNNCKLIGDHNVFKILKEAGCDCVKFQKSNLNEKFTNAALNRPYENENSWGATYKEHKEYLEFSLSEIRELKKFADNLGILFSTSAMDIVSLRELADLDLPFIKIGSGDANNYPLLETAAKLSVPLVISTGMQSQNTIDKVIRIMNNNGKRNFCLLHCVSSYPTQPEDTNLLTINLFQEKYPEIPVGYSGHDEGILISLASVMLGAKIIEKHFTLDKNMKGTDHKCSLTPIEMRKLVQSIRTMEKQYYTEKNFNPHQIEQILSKEMDNFSTTESSILKLALKDVKVKDILECELPCRKKLGKSLVYNSNLNKEHTLQEKDITVKVSEPFGVSAEKYYDFIGQKLHKDVFFDEPLFPTDFAHEYMGDSNY